MKKFDLNASAIDITGTECKNKKEPFSVLRSPFSVLRSPF